MWFPNSQNAKSLHLTSWRYDVNVSKQTTDMDTCHLGVPTSTLSNTVMALDGIDVGTPKWCVSMGCIIDQVHEAMNPSLM